MDEMLTNKLLSAIKSRKVAFMIREGGKKEDFLANALNARFILKSIEGKTKLDTVNLLKEMLTQNSGLHSWVKNSTQNQITMALYTQKKYLEFIK